MKLPKDRRLGIHLCPFTEGIQYYSLFNAFLKELNLLYSTGVILKLFLLFTVFEGVYQVNNEKIKMNR